MKQFIFLILVLSLIGCQSVKQEEVETKEVASQQQNNSVEEETKALADYSKLTSPYIMKLKRNMDKMNRILVLGYNSPTYVQDIELVCNELKGIVTEIKGLDVGKSKEVMKVHILFMNAMSDYEFVADHYPDALKTGDNYYVQTSAEHMKSGGENIQKVSDKLIDALGEALNN